MSVAVLFGASSGIALEMSREPHLSPIFLCFILLSALLVGSVIAFESSLILCPHSGQLRSHPQEYITLSRSSLLPPTFAY